MRGRCRWLRLWVPVWAMALAALAVFHAPAWCQGQREPMRHGKEELSPRVHRDPQRWGGVSPLQRQQLMRRFDRGLPPPPRVQARLKTYERLSPEDKARLKGRFQEWRSLPPQQQEDLRNRMEQWRQLPPQDRELYRKRFDQWQNLSPEERYKYRDKLQHWESLSPQEREDIRRRFGGK
jgi:hypothetical protein